MFLKWTVSTLTLLSFAVGQPCGGLSEANCNGIATCHWTKPRNEIYNVYYCAEANMVFNDECETVFCENERECVDPTLSKSAIGDSQCWWRGGYGNGNTRINQCSVCGSAARGIHQSCTVQPASVECRCDLPYTGVSVNTPATCLLDECSTAICQSSSQILLADRTCSGITTTPLVSVGNFPTPDDCRQSCTATHTKCLYFEYNTVSLDCWYIPVQQTLPTGGGVNIYNENCPSRNLHTAAINTNIYIVIEYDCTDSNTAAESDYNCECDLPLLGNGKGLSPVCGYDECVMLDPCRTVGLGYCTDPVPTVDSLNDYTCDCPTPTSPGCTFDECAANPCGPLQTCTDPNQQSLFDFQCQCDGVPDTVVSINGPANCYLNECDTSPCGVTQMCFDEVAESLTNSLNDYTCSCIPPSTGVAVVGGPTMCVYDECVDQSGIALCGQNQVCNDPVQTADSLYDFTCTCRNNGGSAVGRPVSVCDDCSPLINPPPCGLNTQQICTDPQPGEDSQFDFICECPLPSTGYAIGNTAACYYDECRADPCLFSQRCEDRDWRYPQAMNSYTCTCISPATGTTTTGTAAVCTFNECPGTPCGAGSGQTCNDPNPSAESLRDFICTCAGSAISQVGFPARCSNPMGIDGPFDECAISGSNGAGPCNIAQFQSCFDTFTTVASLNNYICFCNAPASGTPQSNAQATCTHDECTFTACLGIVSGVCNPYHHQGVTQCGRWQTCADPNTSPLSTKDYSCGCGVVPWVFGNGGQQQSYGNTNTGRPAECFINECNPCGHISTQAACIIAATSIWECSWNIGSQTCNSLITPCGNQASQQSCTEGSLLATDLYDFTCRCNGLYQGMTRGGPAVCFIDECRGGTSRPGHLHYDPHNAGTIALGPCGIGQICDDPDVMINDNFICRCRAPGSSAAAPFIGQQQPAVCSYNLNECWDFLGCLRSQFPLDLVANPNNNIRSRCEITFNSLLQPCGVSQRCVDPIIGNENTDLQNYECSCMFGSTSVSTTGIGRPSICIVDECLITNPCGPNDITNTRGIQTCMDPNTSPTSLYDFICTCTTSTIYATGIPANCHIINECDSDVCTVNDKTQICIDPDFSVRGDFRCSCSIGVGTDVVGGPTTCLINQCDGIPVGCSWSGAITATELISNSVSRPLFLLSETTEPSIGDCQTACIAVTGCKIVQYDPVTQSCYMMPIGSINYVYSPPLPGLDVINSYVCFEVVCTDPDQTSQSLFDISYNCVEPSVGSFRNVFSIVGICRFDECQFDSCGEMQHCNDPSPFTNSINDYECSCLVSRTGVVLPYPPAAADITTGSAAVCVVNECLLSPRCGSGQLCTDPDEAVVNDFTCSCTLPLTGVNAVGQPAQCIYNECVDRPCDTSEYYSCSDPIQLISAIGNYICSCNAPAVIISNQCLLDECQTVCPTSDNTCIDSDQTMTGGVQCTPLPPHDECTTSGQNPCGEGQSCLDMNTHPASLLDFRCTCDNNRITTSTGEPVLQCLHDECQGYDCGLSTSCVDPSRNTHNGNLNDFECHCTAPSVGTVVVGGPVVCYYNECSILVPCHDSVSSQWCLDPTPTPSQRGDFECFCIHPYSGRSIGSTASCVLDECLISPPLCNPNYDCFDPDTGTSLSSRNNVVCTLKSTPIPTTESPLTPFPPSAMSGCGNNSCSSCLIQSDCNSLSVLCVWTPAVNICSEERPPPSSCFDSQLQTEISCITSSLNCRWNVSSCVPNSDMIANEECDSDTFCRSINNFLSCDNYKSTCTWIPSSLRCVRNSCCSARTRMIDCQASGCTWLDTVILGQLQCVVAATASCSLLIEPDDCYASSLNCYWDSTGNICLIDSGIGCNRTCSGCLSQSSCVSQSCSWDQLTKVCSIPLTLQPPQSDSCDVTQAEVCVLESSCRWLNGNCLHFTTFFNECVNNSNPCGVVPAAQGGQLCSDPTHTVNSLQDFICICPNNPNIRNQSSPVTDCSVVVTESPVVVSRGPVYIVRLSSGRFPLPTINLLQSLQNISGATVTIEWHCKAQDCLVASQCNQTECSCPLLQRDSCVVGSGGSNSGAVAEVFVGFTVRSASDPQVLLSLFQSRLSEIPFSATVIMFSIPPPVVTTSVPSSSDAIPSWVIPVAVVGIVVLVIVVILWAYFRSAGTSNQPDQKKYQTKNTDFNDTELEGSQNTSNPLESEFSPRREEAIGLYH